MSQRISHAETAIASGLSPVWVLTLSLPDGRALRFSTEAISISTTYAGADGPYQPAPLLLGLDEFDEEYDAFSLDGLGALTQAKVDIGTTVDLGGLQSDHYAVTASTAELALLWPGQTWEDRFVALSGAKLHTVEFGTVGQTTSFVLETTPPVASLSVGDDTRDMGEEWAPGLVDTAGEAMTDVSGAKFVWVFGAPLSVPAYKVGVVSAANRVVMAGHVFPDVGSITFYDEGVSVGALTPVNVASVTLPYIYASSATEFLASDGGITYAASRGGICRADDTTRAALTAGQVMRKLLSMSGQTVDWRKSEPCFVRLDEWEIGFYVDEQCLAIDVIRDRMLPFLPVIEFNSGEGIWFAYVDPHRAEIEAHLINGQNVGRIGRMVMSDLEQVYNSFTINFYRDEFSSDQGGYTEAVTVDADTNTLCYLSEQLYGKREADPIDCDIVWDETAARKVLLAKIDRLALPRRILTYLAAPDLYWLSGGMVVVVTDADYGITEARGVITKIGRSTSPFTLTVELVDRSALSEVA